jgi:hypothetical protein
MDAKINIAKILKDKPQGTKLYSSACGKCELIEADDKSFKVSFYSSKFGFMNGGEGTFDKNGNLYDDGECVVFPSKEMRDWRKFAWKKGDVLVSYSGKVEVIFEKFECDTYQSFIGKHHLESLDENLYYQDGGVYPTASFNIETEDAAQTYIKTIEEKLDGKLNLESLEIEKTQPEFKDGDVLFVKCEERDFIEIFNYSKKNGDLCDYASLDTLAHHLDISGKYKIVKEDIVKIRLATEEEKKQFFSALEKEGKAWDSDKKQIVDLPKKCEFKVFEKVLVRESKTDEWTPNFFFKIHRDDERYVMVCGDMYNYCIPYNEETAHLLGTTDEWKGGEG